MDRKYTETYTKTSSSMEYRVISADCHIDLIWLPPELFVDNASEEMKERMPYVRESEDGPVWVSNQGAYFGLQNGMGSAGRNYVPGQIHRSDRMASTGLYEDGKKGIRRITDPELRIRDQDLDGVQGEVLYGILGAAQRLCDPPASEEMMRIYNDWLIGFCSSAPERFAGIACIPSHDMKTAVEEILRVGSKGVLRGLEVATTSTLKPLWHPEWHPVWEGAQKTGLPVHFHTIGGKRPSTEGLTQLQTRQSFACWLTGFQLQMSEKLMQMIYGAVFEKFPALQLVIGESGIGWIPYILERMDLEWEEQFRDLELTMKPSDYWRRNCHATFQNDPAGLKLIDRLGAENVMWASDFPHPDGVWPDSLETIRKEFTEISDSVRQKIVCDNALHLYRFGSA